MKEDTGRLPGSTRDVVAPEAAGASSPSVTIPIALSDEERELLSFLSQSAASGAYAMACDGKKSRAIAHALEQKGLAYWCGTSWGSSFWRITSHGLILAQGIDTRSAETEGLRPKDESPVGNADAPNPSGEDI